MQTTPARPSAGSAERPRSRGPLLAGGVVMVLVAVAVGWWLTHRSVSLDLDDLDRGSALARAAGDGAGGLDTVRAAATSGLLTRVQQALSEKDRRELDRLARGSARSRAVLRRWADNIDAIGLRDLRLRYVAATVQARDRWTGEVEVSYLDPFAGQGRVRTVAAVSFADVGPGAEEQTVVVGAGGEGARTPLWMSADLEVRTAGRVSARVGTGASVSLERLSRLGATAVKQVRRTLPGWQGRLVIEVPEDTVEVAHVLGEPEGAYDAVAAVTTTVDGSARVGAPVHVVVNPVVLGTLDNRGEQVVMTHEAVHVATAASTSPGLPLWLMEGFADWVALRVADLPDDVAAGAVLQQVRDQGPPSRLPGALEFDPGGDQFGVSYEAAWLAVRLMAERYGARATLDFYRQVDRGSPVAEVFEDLGTTEQDFTVAWQRYLQRLAGVPVDAGATTS